MAQGKRKRGADGGSTSRAHWVARNRATPARLVKLYKSMSPAQRSLVSGVGFGGLLKIGSSQLPSAICKWLVNSFHAESSNLVIPGRGKIKVNADSANRILGLPMGEEEVKYEFNGSAINFINGKCGFEDGRAPSITSIVEKLEKSKEHNDDYLRWWLMVAISTFLCGNTSLSISPKCYPSLVDPSKVNNLNWCQFIVDTLKSSDVKMEKQDSVMGCQYFLLILYLESLDVGNLHIPQDKPRIAAWNKQLINKVIKLDTYTNGTFGKLKLKKLDDSVTEASLFGDLNDIENFVSHRASASISSRRKRKFCEIVKKACVGFTEVIGTFVHEASAIPEESDDSEDQEETTHRRSTRRRTNTRHQHADFIDDGDEDDADFNADEDQESEDEEDKTEEDEESSEEVSEEYEEEEAEEEAEENEEAVEEQEVQPQGDVAHDEHLESNKVDTMSDSHCTE